MIVTAASVRRTYYVLSFGNTFAASLIWGVNTIFLLDAGLSMLLGAGGGGYLAQFAGLGAPYVLRAAVLVLMFVLAAVLMRDLGFIPGRGPGPLGEVRKVVGESVEYGLRVPAVRYLMFAAPFTGGVGIYVGYALQPHLLDLWGDEQAYGVAGLAAALLAGAQIAADLWGYPASYLVSAALSVCALPFVWRSRRASTATGADLLSAARR